MSDTEWDEEESPPPPCPIRVGPGSITYSRRMPADLEEVAESSGPWSKNRTTGSSSTRRAAAPGVDGADHVRCSSRTVGCRNHRARSTWTTATSSPEHRAFFIDEIAQAVAAGRCSAGSLAIVVWLEDEPLLIARAAAAYTDARAMEQQDPMPAADVLLLLLGRRTPSIRAGIFLGLMLLGDPGFSTSCGRFATS